jgi:hypothetical protein
VRVRQVGGKKGFRNLDGCVAGLDDLLRNGQVAPHEEVNIRRVVLREWHGSLHFDSNLTPFYAEIGARESGLSVPRAGNPRAGSIRRRVHLRYADSNNPATPSTSYFVWAVYEACRSSALGG